MKSSIAARHASGTRRNSDAAGLANAITTAAMRHASCVRPFAPETTDVRAGLASTANDPANPDRMFPAPSATKSRSMLIASSSLEKLRTVAAVWARQTRATVKETGRTLTTSLHETEGIPTFGSPVDTLPRRWTP